MGAKQKQRSAKTGGPDLGVERQCAVTRTPLPEDQLLRFVRSPTGAIVPDLDRSLPGRGVWVTGHREFVEKALKTAAFSKSLKENINAAPELAQTVADLLARRVRNALSLANKAGLVTAGFEQVEKALEKGQVAVLLHGSDAAEGGRLKLDRKHQAVARDLGRAASIVAVLTIAEMSLAIGRPNVVHAALISGGLSERFLREAGRLERYRASPAASSLVFSEVEHEG